MLGSNQPSVRFKQVSQGHRVRGLDMAYEALDFFDVDKMLNEEEIMLRDMVRDWVDEKVIPNIEKAYNEGLFP